MIKIDDIKKLREITGVPIGACQKALEVSSGDFDEAIFHLKKEGLEVASKKSSRDTDAGIVDAYIHGDGRIGVLIEVKCETDFVARNEEFLEMVHNIAMHIAATNPQEKEGMLSEPYIKNQNVTIKDYIKETIQKFGENIVISRFTRFEL